jgi:hypothetical protein
MLETAVGAPTPSCNPEKQVKKLSLRSGLLATTTICGAALSTLAGGALVATVATMLPATAQAQDYTSGALVGTVTDASGKPVSGAAVTLTSKAVGQARSASTNVNGQFTATGLAPGEYTVNVTASGYTDFSGNATIVISQEARYDYALTAVGTEATTVVVKGKRVRQDFAKTTTGLTVDLDTLTSQQPIARNLTAVTMLAPTVTQGNPGFGNVASFGGGSVAENAYYINGLNITNPDTYVGSAQVPFDFYKTIEVKTAGYSSEFGRATGGVVNAVTKSGTNEFMFAVHGNFAPGSFRNDQLDTYDYRGKFTDSSTKSLTVEAGGPIIKDALFAYALYQANDNEYKSAGRNTGIYKDTTNKDPFLGVKLDGYITPKHHLELTYFDTTNTDDITTSNYDDEAQTVGSEIAGGKATEKFGGENWVGKYTGTLTDWFTISAAYGVNKDSDDFTPENTELNYVIDRRSGVPLTASTTQPWSTIEVDDTERKFYRFDGDLRFDALGHHHVRFGMDHEDNSMTKTTRLVGAVPVLYDFRAGGPTGERVRVTYESLGGHVSASNEAYYVQDSWDVTKDLNIQLGLRNDDFTQNNLSGEKYLDLKNNVAPRLGFSWDPTGEGTWKIYGNVGAYFIPPAMNLGYRGKDLYYREYFLSPTGGFVLDPVTGLPESVGDPNPIPASGYDAPCPDTDIAQAPGLGSAPTGNDACVIFGNGSQEGATSKTELSLKATEEDEVVLGATYRANDLWTLGLSYTNRSLKRISEDSDFNDAIIAYLDTNGLDSSQYVGGSSYYVWNVGDHDATIRLKQVLTGETEQRVITLTADQLGHYHDPKRSYSALVFDFKRAFDGKWGLQGSYTLSKSYGNYEGTVKSDVGNSQQTDAGSTIAFDSPGFEDYGTGLLPNDRTHTLKVWGSYALTSSLLVGANVLIQSAPVFGCLGVHPTDAYAASYGAYSHYCDGVPAPQGKALKGDWTKNIDVSMRYTVPDQYAMGGKLILRADIFNLFDSHSVATRYVQHDLGSDFGDPTNLDLGYGSVTGYSTPRYMRIGFDLSY